MDQKPSEAAHSAVFSKFDNIRQEAAVDFISGVDEEKVGMDAPVKVGCSRLNSERPNYSTRWAAGRTLLRTFVQYLWHIAADWK